MGSIPLTGDPAGPRAVLAGTVPGRTWRRDLDAAMVAALPELLAVPETAAVLSGGDDPRLGRLSPNPLVLVCTNGRRDTCCAQFGRPAAAALVATVARERRGALRRHRGVDVLESSHLGGHRFAPTAVVLPWGLVYGGLGREPEPLTRAVVDLLADRTALDGYRGRSTYPPPAQAAEAVVRRDLAVAGVHGGPDDVVVDDVVELTEPGELGGGLPESGVGEDEVLSVHRVLLRHTGGRTFRVTVRRVRTAESRPPSCGAEPEPLDLWWAAVDADSAPGLYLPAL